MAQTHKVEQGDCLASIAARYGFADYKAIWNDGKNSALRAKRKNPNVLYPGDVVSIPDIREKKEARSTSKSHTFQIHQSIVLLKLTLQHVPLQSDGVESEVPEEDEEAEDGSAACGDGEDDGGTMTFTDMDSGDAASGGGNYGLSAVGLAEGGSASTSSAPAPAASEPPLFANKRYEMRVGEHILRGQTDAQGRIEQKIPAAATEAHLQVWLSAEDTQSEGFPFLLKIGHLDPVETPSGVTARLNNLGYCCSEGETLDDDATQTALKSFQTVNGLQPTGTPDAATKNKLLEKHLNA